jgi:hypothetical protein
VIGDSQALATLADEEGPLSFSVSNAHVVEGDSGTTTATFVVSLQAAPAAGQTARVEVATANGTAASGSDYVALPPTTLSFAASELSKTVTVTVNGDGTVETDEVFFLNLTNPAGGVVSDAQAAGTITNDD